MMTAGRASASRRRAASGRSARSAPGGLEGAAEASGRVDLGEHHPAGDGLKDPRHHHVDLVLEVAAAALDVFQHEPLSPDSPLWALPNVLITPHVAGFLQNHWDAVTALFADNLRRFDSGQTLINVVDKREGY